ncbi:MAG: hypothetical protein ACXAC8_00895 [Candidatus Hodarchaeales archaeon]
MFVSLCLIFFISSSSTSTINSLGYQFIQLNPFFEKSLAGMRFDYNPSAPEDQAFVLLNDLVNQSIIANESDFSNIISLIGHETHGINTMLLALEQVKRTQDLPIIGSVDWQTIVPFVKYLNQYSLSSQENVIISQDILGLALKINGSGFNPSQYQIGYANVPLDFFKFLMPDDGFFSGAYPRVNMVSIQESNNELLVELIYSNLTFLFQTASFDLETFLDPVQYPNFQILSNNLMIVQFDQIKFSFSIRKYAHYGNVGVEMFSEITIGNVINLIINEGLSQDHLWETAEEYEIQSKFLDAVEISETFSWYQENDIITRLQKFSEISFSLITAQNIGILNNNGTPVESNIHIIVDNQTSTKNELKNQNEITVTEEISMHYNEELFFFSQAKGLDFATQKDSRTGKISLIPVESRIIPLNQQNNLKNDPLFNQETFLLRDLVIENVKRFIADPELTQINSDFLYATSGLSLPSAYYLQDFQVKGWEGSQITLNVLQNAVKVYSDPSTKTKNTNITLFSPFPGIMALFVLSILFKRAKKFRKSEKYY